MRTVGCPEVVIGATVKAAELEVAGLVGDVGDDRVVSGVLDLDDGTGQRLMVLVGDGSGEGAEGILRGSECGEEQPYRCAHGQRETGEGAIRCLRCVANKAPLGTLDGARKVFRLQGRRIDAE